jgi:hypothetical protein
MTSQRKLLFAAAISALILACALCILLIAWFFLGGNSNPTPTSSPAQATITPAIQSIPLQIKAEIDGSDVINITPGGVTLRHIAWKPPSAITLNAVPFSPDSPLTLEQIGLSQAELSTATVITRHGRGTIAVENVANGIAIHFADPQGGAASYQIALTFMPKSAQSPATLPAKRPADSAVLDIKAFIRGSDLLTISPTGAIWKHVALGWPSNVQFDDHPWSPETTRTLNEIDLSNLDFSSAWMESQTGRDTLVMEKSNNALNIYFCDTPGGGSDYEIKIRVPHLR